MSTDFPNWPAFTEEEGEAVKRVLLSNAVNYWTGEECRQFEREFAAWSGARHAIALSNGTVALEAALHALELQPGDEVIVTPRSFIASASCVAMVGATPVFADVDSDTQNITAETIEAQLTPNSKAILCVHLAGMPCEMDPIMALARRYGLYVIEDCAQAHGARYRGQSVGTIGDIGAWSFCQDKIVTTGGEGGMITTNSDDLWSRMWSFKDHGKSWEAVSEREHPLGFRWLHESLGTNGRMTEMQAAIGRIQLRHLPGWSAIRQSHARQLWETAAVLPCMRVPALPDWATHAAYRCYVFVDQHALANGWDRDRIVAAIVAAGVPCYTGACPEIYREKAFVDQGLEPPERLPVARALGESSLMFLVHPTLTRAHIDRTCTALTEVMLEAAGRSDPVDRRADVR